MGLLGILWELYLEPMLYWLTQKWVRFVVRKPTIWEPGVPFPRYFEQIKYAVLHTPFKPWRIHRALLPMPRLGNSWDSVVLNRRGR